MKYNNIPEFKNMMLPVLKILGDQKEHTLQQLIKEVADYFKLSEQDRQELLPSGNQAVITNRVGWVRTYFLKAGLIDVPRRATFIITNEGLRILKSNPTKIDNKFLETLPKFKEWRNSTTKNNAVSESSIEEETSQTPQELLEYSFSKINDELSFELLEKIKSCTPAFFERLVVDLLLKMGYGGYRKDAGYVLGKSGDGGIDGVIKEDKLGLDAIYVQAKKWENQVTISSVRDFAGSLLSKKAKKGIFITTSAFPQSAYDFVNSIEHKIVLIDGNELAKLLIEYNVGISVRTTYEIKRIDTDYFEEFL